MKYPLPKRRTYTRKTQKEKTKKTQKHKKEKFKKLNCSQKPKQKKGNYTCYSNNTLQYLKKLWNLRHPDVKINETSDRDIWNKLKEKMQNSCDEESCWLRQNFVKNKVTNEMINYTFMPPAPNTWKSDINTWLNSTDISNVMKHYEKNYNNFAFIGPSPIDFDIVKLNKLCVWNELCNFNLQNIINKNKNKIGIIFNLDYHTGKGTHWVALFIDIKKKYIFFFDSIGNEIPHQIHKLVEKIIYQGKHLREPINFHFDKNSPFEHQQGQTECGMYCLYFIISLLTNKKNPNYFKTTIISDKEMESCRHEYFNII